MKLIYCPECGDVFQLRLKSLKKCECGKVKGRYITKSLAEVSENAISLAIGNGALNNAIVKMMALKDSSGNTADRQQYIKDANLIFAWVRPNEGPGNPHTRVIKEGGEK